MKKILVLSSLFFLFLGFGCANNEIVDKDYEKALEYPKTEMEVFFDSVALKVQDPWISDDYIAELEFYVYLSRPDLNLSQKDYVGQVSYTSDLPAGLQPRYMYVSNVDDKEKLSGRICDRPLFPHVCPFDVKEYKEQDTFIVKVAFEDGTYAEKEITIPFPELLDSPEIVEPKILPEQNSKLNFSFKDIGADKYDIRISLCRPYANDGINPCLDGAEYALGRRDGKLVLDSFDDGVLKVQNGVVNISSDKFTLTFEEMVEYYIHAFKSELDSGGNRLDSEMTKVQYFER